MCSFLVATDQTANEHYAALLGARAGTSKTRADICDLVSSPQEVGDQRLIH